jgi:hypothetical protein
MRRFVLAALAILLATSAFAQLPPGKWWRRPEIVQQLQLTEDQQFKLDAIWRDEAKDLIDLKAEMDKQSINLRGELDQPTLNRAAIRQIAAKLSDARARRFERELMMFVDMRAVLTDTQWNRMRTVLDRIAANAAIQQQERQQQQQQQQRRNQLQPRD